MKQKIYEIPIWDAYQLDNCECPICSIEKQLENKFIETLFTEMVMDVNLNPQLVENFRFCHQHFEKLYKYPDKCGLAILTDRILYLEKEALEKIKLTPSIKKDKKLSLLFKKDTIVKNGFTDHTCFLCNKLEADLESYCTIISKLWEKDSKFKNLFSKSRGFCLNHFEMMINLPSSSSAFKDMCIKIQEENLTRIQEELQWFITKNDYRFIDEPWKTSKDALLRTIQKLIGNYDTKI